MFSKELEEVIEAALADGVITEKERAVLHKRALAEGVDPDELDVVIDGRLAKVKKETDWLRPVPPPQAAPANNGKYGVVRKCPNCGAQVKASAVKCDECGYEFVGVEANRSVAKLSVLINNIDQHWQGKTSLQSLFGASSRSKEMYSTIVNFPVPTTKEDLLEFVLFLKPKAERSLLSEDNEGERKILRAYRTKYKECMQKAQVFFADDPQFRQVFEQEKKGLFGKMFSFFKK